MPWQLQRDVRRAVAKDNPSPGREMIGREAGNLLVASLTAKSGPLERQQSMRGPDGRPPQTSPSTTHVGQREIAKAKHPLGKVPPGFISNFHFGLTAKPAIHERTPARFLRRARSRRVRIPHPRGFAHRAVSSRPRKYLTPPLCRDPDSVDLVQLVDSAVEVSDLHMVYVMINEDDRPLLR